MVIDKEKQEREKWKEGKERRRMNGEERRGGRSGGEGEWKAG